MRAACLPPARTMKLNSTARYRRERAVQEPLFLAERKEKKRQKQIEKNLRQGQLAHEKAVKRRAEREAAEAKKAAAEKTPTLVKPRQSERRLSAFHKGGRGKAAPPTSSLIAYPSARYRRRGRLIL